MAAHYIWFALAVILVIAEMIGTTLYLLVVALGAIAGGAASMLGKGLAVQFVVAAVVALVGFVILRRSRYGQVRRGAAATDPNVNLDIGQEVVVAAWDADGRARARYRGAEWSVQLQGSVAAPAVQSPLAGAGSERYRIVEVRGNTLFVSRA